MPYSYYIVIDTETTGMPLHCDSAMDQTEEWPYILQLAWLVLDHDGNLVKEENHYLKNRGIEIDKQAQQLHGITKEILKDKGVSKRGMLKRLYKDIKRYNPLIIGHFVEFDMKMLTVETNRLKLNFDYDGVPLFCTMLMSGIKSHHPRRQYPSLSELYQQCFNKPLEHAHDAVHDARAAATVFLHLVENGLFEESLVVPFDAKPSLTTTGEDNPNLLQKIKDFISRK